MSFQDNAEEDTEQAASRNRCFPGRLCQFMKEEA
jgi:hypothetical protein